MYHQVGQLPHLSGTRRDIETANRRAFPSLVELHSRLLIDDRLSSEGALMCCDFRVEWRFLRRVGCSDVVLWRFENPTRKLSKASAGVKRALGTALASG